MSENTEEESLHWFDTPYATKENFNGKNASYIYMAYLFIPAIAAVIVGSLGRLIGYTDLANLNMLAVITTYVGLLALYKPIFKESPFKHVKSIKKKHVTMAIKGFIVLILGNVVLTLIPSPVPENQQALVDTLSAGSALLFGTFTVLLAPLVEELLFRKIFFRSFTSENAESGKVLFIANIVVFTVLHTGLNVLVNPGGTLQYAWMSFIFAYMFAKTRSLEASLVLHLINNGVAFMALTASQYLF